MCGTPRLIGWLGDIPESKGRLGGKNLVSAKCAWCTADSCVGFRSSVGNVFTLCLQTLMFLAVGSELLTISAVNGTHLTASSSLQVSALRSKI